MATTKAKHGARPNRLRLVIESVIVLPFYLYVFVNLASAIVPAASLAAPRSVYWVLLLVSAMAFVLSRFYRSRLFSPDEIPTDTSMFISTLAMFPFVLAAPASSGATAFLVMDASVVVASVLLGLIGTTFRRGEFPARDNPTVFFMAVAAVAVTAVLSMLALSFGGATAAAGLAVGYLAVFLAINTAIYAVQLLAYMDGVKLSNAF